MIKHYVFTILAVFFTHAGTAQSTGTFTLTCAMDKRINYQLRH